MHNHKRCLVGSKFWLEQGKHKETKKGSQIDLKFKYGCFVLALISIRSLLRREIST